MPACRRGGASSSSRKNYAGRNVVHHIHGNLPRVDSRRTPPVASYYYHHPLRLCPTAELPWLRPACYQIVVSCRSVQLCLLLLLSSLPMAFFAAAPGFFCSWQFLVGLRHLFQLSGNVPQQKARCSTQTSVMCECCRMMQQQTHAWATATSRCNEFVSPWSAVFLLKVSSSRFPSGYSRSQAPSHPGSTFPQKLTLRRCRKESIFTCKRHGGVPG